MLKFLNLTSLAFYSFFGLPALFFCCTEGAKADQATKENEPLSEEVSWNCGGAVSYQGYDYATVLIGEQCWFAENLRNENYQNGDVIPSA